MPHFIVKLTCPADDAGRRGAGKNFTAAGRSNLWGDENQHSNILAFLWSLGSRISWPCEACCSAGWLAGPRTKRQIKKNIPSVCFRFGREFRRHFAETENKRFGYNFCRTLSKTRTTRRTNIQSILIAYFRIEWVAKRYLTLTLFKLNGARVTQTYNLSLVVCQLITYLHVNVNHLWVGITKIWILLEEFFFRVCRYVYVCTYLCNVCSFLFFAKRSKRIGRYLLIGITNKK